MASSRPSAALPDAGVRTPPVPSFFERRVRSAVVAARRGPEGNSSDPGEPPMSETTGLPPWHGTTILCLKKAGRVVMAGDGQVSMGDSVVKAKARKVRRLADGRVLAGFAGATADAFTLLERLESKLERFPAQLTRACVELAKDWRTDRYLRRLEALLAVSDGRVSLLVSGNGDVLEPDDGIIGIGSGGNYALAAARALIDLDLDAEEIARRAMKVAAGLCVYTNDEIVVESLETEP